MKNLRLRAWMVGTLLAAAVALASYSELPGLREIEARTLDSIFRHGRANPPEPTRAIVHLDIDDQSLDLVGEWPWPRALLARSIRMIDDLGARVIAVDILLTEPREPDGDQELEEVFRDAQAKVILAVNPIETAAQLEGAQRWDDIVGALRTNIRLDADDLVQGLKLSPERAARVRDHLNKYKRIAIRRAVHELRDEDRVSLGALRARLLVPADRALTNFPELPLLRKAITHSNARLLLERTLPLAQPNVSYAHADSVKPALERFAQHVEAGVVKAEPDPDGFLRHVTLRWNIRGRVYPQLGAAAAAAFLDVSPETFAAEPMTFPGAQQPLTISGDRILLSWPRVDPLHPTKFAPHVPLGRVLELARGERELARLVTEQRKRTRELVQRYLATEYSLDDLDNPETAAEIEEELAGEAEMQLQEVEGHGEEETEAERQIVTLWRNWVTAREKILAAQEVLPPARRRLAEAIDGKLVFVGWSASGNFGDFYSTAADRRTPGVVAHGVVANSIITSYVVTRAPRWVGALMALVLGVIATFVTRRVGPRFSFFLILLLATLYLTVNLLVVFDERKIVIATAAPMLSIFAAWAATTVVRAIRERREKAQLQRQFGARVSPKLFEFLIEHPDLVHLEGEEREVTCFFSDLAGFTEISESLDSKRTVALLNAYMFAMNEVLTRHSAYVNKFLGDGIMTVWGAFERDTPHAESACRAALECQTRLQQMNEGAEMDGLSHLAMRIGIATGVVTLGDCGAPPDLRDYTVIGDSANLAARLESANKQFGTRILINGTTKSQISDEILTRPLGRVTVVGQKTPTEIHEVVALTADASDEQRARIEQTSEAIDAFVAREWDAATSLWQALDNDAESTVIAGLYLAAIEVARAESDADFDGVLHLTRK